MVPRWEQFFRRININLICKSARACLFEDGLLAAGQGLFTHSGRLDHVFGDGAVGCDREKIRILGGYPLEIFGALA